jgi:HK97 family phage portal protein
MSYDGLHGMSPIEYSKNAIGLSIALEEHGSNLFSHGANPNGVFETDRVLSDEAFERLKADLKSSYTGLSNSNKPMLLEDGIKFKQISLTNNDSQFLESRKFQRSEIASIFRVPPHLIGDLERATFTNIEQQSLEFATYTLTPWVQRFEQAINIALARVYPNLRVDFDMDAMVRGDIQSRYNANGTAIRDGWLTRNEVRIKEGLNPLDGLDEPILPLNMGTGGENED